MSSGQLPATKNELFSHNSNGSATSAGDDVLVCRSYLRLGIINRLTGDVALQVSRPVKDQSSHVVPQLLCFSQAVLG